MKSATFSLAGRLMRPSAVLAGALLLAGCMVGPNYARPKVIIPESFSQTVEGKQAIEWWKAFQDPQLDSLIQRAARTNLSVRAATAAIRQARAQRDLATAGLFPTVNVTGEYSRGMSAENLNTNVTSNSNSGGTGGTGGSGGTGGTGSSGSTTVVTGGQQRTDLYQAGFDASWEMDVFGGVRRQIESDNASITAAVENRREVMLTLLGEVATDYIQLRGFQERIKIAEDNIKSQNDTLKITKDKFNAGVDTALNVAQIQAVVATTEATIPPLRTSAMQTIYALSLLLGEEPRALVEELADPKPVPTAGLVQVPLGLPSQLLERRPDVRQAEAQLHAATANIGVATSDLFPRFALTGSLGQESGTVKRFFNSNSEFWSFGPSVSWPVLDFGAIRANIRVQNALQEQALIAYEQAVLTSLSDVENALIGYDQQQFQLKALNDAVVANKRAVDLSLQQFKAGTVDFLTVTTSEQSLFASQDALAQDKILIETDLVALYKALGGGWETFEKKSAKDPYPSTIPSTEPFIRPATLPAIQLVPASATQPVVVPGAIPAAPFSTTTPATTPATQP